MTKIAIEYNKDKNLMLAEAITRAANIIDKKRMIWLVWTDSTNLRDHFFDGKMNVLSRDDIKTLLNGERLDYGSYYIRSISAEKISAIRPDDVVIDCFTGMLYMARSMNGSLLIHLPWTQYESNSLSNSRYINSID